MLNNKNIIKIIASVSLFAHIAKAEFKIQESVFVPHNLGRISLSHNKKGFKVLEENGSKHKVKNHNIDGILHKMDSGELTKFLAHGYLALNKNDAGEYSIKAKVRGNGGGPITANVLYWVTKTVGYGTVAAAAGSATMAAIPVATAALGGSAVATMAVNGAATGAYIVATGTAAGAGMATGGAAVVGSALASTAVTAEAATLATGGLLAAGGGCIVTGVETASWGAFAVGLWLPLP